MMKLAPATLTSDFVTLRDAIDRLVDESLVWPASRDGHIVSFQADLSETPDAYLLKASLPGVKPEDVKIETTADGVTITGEYKSETETKGETFLRKERKMGSFERSFTFPLPIEPDKVEAAQANGILTITLPKAERSKPKRIAVKIT